MPMPNADYSPPLWMCNGHIQTMWPVLFRNVELLPATRVRLKTPDNDFVDVDVMRSPASTGRRVVVLSHGLEGNVRRKYMQGMARSIVNVGWDVVGRHMRGCSGELQRAPGKYHMGETEDIHLVIQYCLEQGWTDIVLAGFSMGGSQTLKYLGENPQRVPTAVKAGIGISVPCDLVGASLRLSSPSCAIYMQYFMRTMKKKTRAKAAMHPHFPSLEGLEKIRTFDVFDERFTAPLNGFSSAHDYWTKCACLPVLPQIAVPVLLINAADDPFMTPSCHPVNLAQNSKSFTFLMPKHGGHVGFVTSGPQYWSEAKVAQYLRSQLA